MKVDLIITINEIGAKLMNDRYFKHLNGALQEKGWGIEANKTTPDKFLCCLEIRTGMHLIAACFTFDILWSLYSAIFVRSGGNFQSENSDNA